MNMPFRRFLAALTLACPGAALAGSPAPIVPLAAEQPAPAPLSSAGKPAALPAACDPPVVLPAASGSPADTFWVGAEFFLGMRQGSDVPALLTTFPGNTPAPANQFPGGLGVPGTQVAFGQKRFLNNFGPGLRLNAGFFLGDDHTWSVDGNFSALRDASETFGIGSTPATGVFVPVFLPGFPGNLAVGFPTVPLTGADARVDTRYLTADTNLRYALVANDTTRLDAFVGYKYAHLTDSVELNTALDLDALLAVPPGTLGVVSTGDTFKTRNNFHGVNVGASGSRRLGDRFTVSAKASVALGRTYSRTEIFGTNNYAGTIFAGFLPPGSGIFAQGTNSGVFNSSQFAVVPEGTLTLGYDVTQRLKATFGYSYLYWSKVKRAADQIDTTGTTAFGFPTGDGRPRFLDRTTDFQVQGLTFGAEFKY